MPVTTVSIENAGTKRGNEDDKQAIRKFLQENDNNRTLTLKHFTREPYNLSSLFVKKTMGKTGKATGSKGNADEVAEAKKKFKNKVQKFIVTRLPLTQELIADCFAHFKQTGHKRRYVRSALFTIGKDLGKKDKKAGYLMQKLIKRAMAAGRAASASSSSTDPDTPSPPKKLKTNAPASDDKDDEDDDEEEDEDEQEKEKTPVPVSPVQKAQTPDLKRKHPKSALKQQKQTPAEVKVNGIPRNVSFGGNVKTPEGPKVVAVKTPIRPGQGKKLAAIPSSPVKSETPVKQQQQPQAQPAVKKTPDAKFKHSDTPRPKAVPKSGKTPEFKVPAAVAPVTAPAQKQQQQSPIVKNEPVPVKSPSPVRKTPEKKAQTPPAVVKSPPVVAKTSPIVSSPVAAKSPPAAPKAPAAFVKNEPVVVKSPVVSGKMTSPASQKSPPAAAVVKTPAAAAQTAATKSPVKSEKPLTNGVSPVKGLPMQGLQLLSSGTKNKPVVPITADKTIVSSHSILKRSSGNFSASSSPAAEHLHLTVNGQQQPQQNKNPEKRVSWGKNDSRSPDLIQFTPVAPKGGPVNPNNNKNKKKKDSIDLMSFTPVKTSSSDEEKVPTLIPIAEGSAVNANNKSPSGKKVSKFSPRMTRSARKQQQKAQ